MTEALVKHQGGVYVRIGRNAVEDVYESDDYEFVIGKAITLRDGSERSEESLQLMFLRS